MKKYNICCPDKYLDKDRQEKTKWNVVGQMVQTDKGGIFIKLYMNPTQILSVFELQTAPQQSAPQPSYQPTPQAQVSNRPSVQGTAMPSDNMPF